MKVPRCGFLAAQLGPTGTDVPTALCSRTKSNRKDCDRENEEAIRLLLPTVL